MLHQGYVFNHTTSYGMVVSCRVKTTVKFLEYYGNMQKIPVSVNDKILNQFMPVSVKELGARWEFGIIDFHTSSCSSHPFSVSLDEYGCYAVLVLE